MDNLKIFEDFIASIKAQAKAQKADPYAYMAGYLQSFVLSNMSDDPEVIAKMEKQTNHNFQAAGRNL